MDIPRVCLCAQARSGSSMMMRMLEFGGLKVDAASSKNKTLMEVLRNPYGLFENIKVVTKHSNSNTFKLLKASMLSKVPEDYKIIFIHRSMREIASSWDEASERGKILGMPIAKQQIYMAEKYNNWEDALSKVGDYLRLEYNSVCLNPLRASIEISSFIDTDTFKFDIENAAMAVDKKLYIDRRK